MIDVGSEIQGMTRKVATGSVGNRRSDIAKIWGEGRKSDGAAELECHLAQISNVGKTPQQSHTVRVRTAATAKIVNRRKERSLNGKGTSIQKKSGKQKFVILSIPLGSRLYFIL